MKYEFRRIAVLPNLSKDKGLLRTRELISCLERDYEVLLGKEFSSLAEKCLARTVNEDEFYASADLVIVLGGDGSILRAADKAAKASVPIIGINLGRLGYIAELETSDICRINEILSGELDTIPELDEQRLRMDGRKDDEVRFAGYFDWEKYTGYASADNI